MKAVLSYDRPAYEMQATDNCYIFQFKMPPYLDGRPRRLGDGSMMAPGDRFYIIGGNHSSASHVTIRLLTGHLEFAGFFSDEQGEIALFRYSHVDDRLCFYGGFVIGNDALLLTFSTPARSARLIETTRVGRVPA